MRGVLGLAVELRTFGSPGGLQIPNFGSVGLHPHTRPKWGCDMFCKSLLYFYMLSIFCLATWSSANTLLFSLFLSYNYALNFHWFSKIPWRFWIYMSFSSIICLFLISKLEILNKIIFICTLYSITSLNTVVILLCSSNFASTPYTNPNVLCCNPSLGLRNKAKGLQGCEPRGKPKNHTACFRECRKVWGNEPSHSQGNSQGNSHFGKWSPNGVPNI